MLHLSHNAHRSRFQDSAFADQNRVGDGGKAANGACESRFRPASDLRRETRHAGFVAWDQRSLGFTLIELLVLTCNDTRYIV